MILRCGVGPTTLDPSLPPGDIAKNIKSEMMTPKIHKYVTCVILTLPYQSIVTNEARQ